jgi:DnaK suppressor protein
MATARKTTKKKAPARTGNATQKKATTKTAARSTKAAASKRTASPNGKGKAEPKEKSNGKAPVAKQAPPLLNQKEMLQQERAQVESELIKFRAELQDAPDMTGDEVDLNVYEREKTLGLVATYERRLEEIETTLKVAAEGKYGICERCGNQIEPERLQIFPETRLCISCKNIVEQEQRRLRM